MALTSHRRKKAPAAIATNTINQASIRSVATGTVKAAGRGGEMLDSISISFFFSVLICMDDLCVPLTAPGKCGPDQMYLFPAGVPAARRAGNMDGLVGPRTATPGLLLNAHHFRLAVVAVGGGRLDVAGTADIGRNLLVVDEGRDARPPVIAVRADHRGGQLAQRLPDDGVLLLAQVHAVADVQEFLEVLVGREAVGVLTVLQQDFHSLAVVDRFGARLAALDDEHACDRR